MDDFEDLDGDDLDDLEELEMDDLIARIREAELRIEELKTLLAQAEATAGRVLQQLAFIRQTPATA